jgi:hypothetical protein
MINYLRELKKLHRWLVSGFLILKSNIINFFLYIINKVNDNDQSINDLRNQVNDIKNQVRMLIDERRSGNKKLSKIIVLF